MSKYLSQAISLIGSQSKLAKAISAQCGRNISQSHITTWLRRNKKGVPAEYCYPIERATEGKIKASKLRPDIDWGSK